MKHKWILLALVTLLLSLTFSAVSAQIPGGPDGDCTDAAGGPIPCPDAPSEEGSSSGGGTSGLPGDRDGDGTPDGSDRCPDAGGHAALAGCPDADGDNTPDIDDQCPAAGGPDSNGGCPVDETAGSDTTAPEPTAAPDAGGTIFGPLPAEGRCVVATQRDGSVNVRSAPDMNAAVVGQLQPDQTVAVLHIWIGTDGTWYRIGAPEGWVSGQVVRVGGDCATVPTSDFGDPAAAQGAIPHWGPNGELTFCLPNYEMGEDTCVPDTTAAGVVPHWGPNGELTFCLPDYAMGEDTCVIIPSSAKPHWPTIDDIVYCIKDEAGEDDCFVLETDTADGGFVIRTALDDTGAPPETPKYHKFMLVGEDGLAVITSAPPADGSTERPNGTDFPLYLAACAPDEECEFQMMMHGEDFPFAACAFNPDAVIQCEVPDNADATAMGTGKASLQDFHFFYMPFNPDFPIAGCEFNPDAVIQCSTDPTWNQWQPEDFPIAACFYDSQTNPETEACDTDNLMNQWQPDDLPIAGCAFNPDLIIQCETDGSTEYRYKLKDVLVSSATDGSNPTPQTREHILLARQTQVPALWEATAIVGLELSTDDGAGLLLPAIQKAREAARRMST